MKELLIEFPNIPPTRMREILDHADAIVGKDSADYHKRLMAKARELCREETV